MFETRTRTITVTVRLTARQTRHRALLQAIAEANARDERPTKMAVIGDVPSRTRADRYRLIDDLIGWRLVDPGPGRTRYALAITDAGREVLAHDSAEVTYEMAEVGEVRWLLREDISDGANFTWCHGSREDALKAASAWSPGTHTVRLTLAKEWQMAAGPREIVASETLYPGIFTVAVVKPGYGTTTIGPLKEHEARSWQATLIQKLTCSAHPEGTEILIEPYYRASAVDCDPAGLPRTADDLADLIGAEPGNDGTGSNFPDLYDRLCAHYGYDRASQLWKQGCGILCAAEDESHA